MYYLFSIYISYTIFINTFYVYSFDNIDLHLSSLNPSATSRKNGNLYEPYSKVKSTGENLRSFLNGKDELNIRGKPAIITNFATKYILVRCQDGSVPANDVCVKCALGQYFNITSRICRPCHVGYYQDKEGQDGCKKCPILYSTYQHKSTSHSDCRRICPPGHYGVSQNLDGIALSPCRRCPASQFQPLEGKVNCQNCPALTIPTYNAMCPFRGDFCTSSPCKNSGICYSEPSLTCLCPEGYWGAFCEKFFNPCDSSPCSNGGSCIKISSIMFECICNVGYGGKLCQTEMDACLSNPCNNGAECSSNSNGFHCECLQGFYGETCLDTLDTCAIVQPCINNGTCSNVIGNQFNCSCLTPFGGRFCELSSVCLLEDEWLCKDASPTLLCSSKACPREISCDDEKAGPGCVSPKTKISVNPDSILTFPKCSATDYMVMDLDLEIFHKLSACLWVQTSDSFNFGTIFSLATSANDNEFTLTDYSGFVIYIKGQRVVTDVVANDGIWHFICVTWDSDGGVWKIYLDGKLADSGSGLSSGKSISGRGKLVVGQEQDHVGGGFNEVESFVGKLTRMYLYRKALSNEEIERLSNSCEEIIVNGSLEIWEHLLQNIKGNIQVSSSTFCASCGPPPTIFLAAVVTEGNQARYRCQTGFLFKFPKEPIQSSTEFWTRKCLITGQWEAKPPICSRVSCGLPGYLLHGSISGRAHLFEDTVRYNCHQGYTLVGPIRRKCLANGQWSGEAPYCRGVGMCQSLTVPRRGTLFLMSEGTDTFSSAVVGDRVEFTCDIGYFLHGSSVLTCMPHGGWDHEEPVCSICAIPKLLPGTTWSFNGSTDRININCASTGESLISDCRLGFWNIPEDFCISSRELCPAPKPPKHGYWLTHTRPLREKFVGDSVSFGCRHGYSLVGDSFITCAENRTWNSSESSCQPVSCGEPYPLLNALLVSNESTHIYGDVVTFRCQSGYQTFGDLAQRCEADGRWSRLHSGCIKKYCGKPDPNLGLTYNGTSFSFGDVLEVACSEGVHSNITCQTDGQWSSPNCNQ